MFVISSGKVYCCSGAQWDPKEGNVGGERPTYSGVFPQRRATTHSTSHLPGGQPQGRKKNHLSQVVHYSFLQITILEDRMSSVLFFI